MKVSSKSLMLVCGIAVFTAFCVVGSADGAEKPGKKTTPSGLVLHDPSDSTEVAMLREVYGMLALADHDYKGHRHHAMQSIAEAAKLLGGHLHGDGKAGEKQPVSDGQLENAKATLSKAGGTSRAAATKGVAKHIQEAIAQLDIALKIK